MRWRRREEPWGSHHVDARALKWEISVGLTEVVVVEEDRDRRMTRAEGPRRMVRRKGILKDMSCERLFHVFLLEGGREGVLVHFFFFPLKNLGSYKTP